MTAQKRDWSDNSGGSTYKDYSLLGRNTALAKEKGLVEAEWYKTPVERKRLKEITKRKNWPGVRDNVLWFALMIAVGYICCKKWGTWWSVLAFAVYGLLYYTCANSRWHECSHYTALKSQWLNETFYHIASVMLMRPGTLWRWEHARHHTDTLIVGRDPQIFTPRPPNLYIMVKNVFNLDLYIREFRRAIRLSFGKMAESEKDIVPASERGKIYTESRIYLFIYVVVIAASIYFHTILPLLFFGLPAMYGAWLSLGFFTIMEHGGLDEDVLDHRMCTRTVYMNPIFRFMHWNMNYHVEHHMYPMVPYHALPAMHEEIKHDCPAPCKSLIQAMLEIWPVVFVQLRDPAYTIVRPLPPNAHPYRPQGAVK